MTPLHRLAHRLVDSPLHDPLRAAFNRRWLPAKGFRSAPFRHNPFTVTEGFRYETTAHDAIAPHLYWQGAWAFEPEVMAVLTEQIRTASMFVDVGANTGIYTLLGCHLNPSLRVHAVEAWPSMTDALRRNVSLNGWDERVTIHAAAAADRSGVVIFAGDDQTPAIGHIVERGQGVTDGALDVVAVTLDELLANEPRVDLVKIDVEGSEPAVVTGMREVLSRHRPTIILEVLPDKAVEDVQPMLDDAGYQYRQLLVDGGSRPVSQLRATSDRAVGTNYLCTPR